MVKAVIRAVEQLVENLPWYVAVPLFIVAVVAVVAVASWWERKPTPPKPKGDA